MTSRTSTGLYRKSSKPINKLGDSYTLTYCKIIKSVRISLYKGPTKMSIYKIPLWVIKQEDIYCQLGVFVTVNF